MSVQAPPTTAPPAAPALAPVTAVKNVPTTAAGPSAPANTLTSHEHFVVGRPHPFGVLLPVDTAQTAFRYRAYTIRVVNFNVEDDVRP